MHASASIVREATDGSAAINRFIATRFELADQYEANGNRADADLMRATWTDVLGSLSTVDRALAAESFSVPVAVPA